MKFADKLFFATVVLLTVIFTVFGLWMLQSNFSRLMNREMERSGSDSRNFLFLFEMGYQAIEDYGDDFAVKRTMEAISDSVNRDGNRVFVMQEDGTFSYGGDYVEKEGFAQELKQLAGALDEEHSYGYCVRKVEDGYYVLTAALTDIASKPLYVGLCRELTYIYQDRQALVAQYRTALVILLLAGGAGIYLLSRYITWPIRSLDRLAGRIADGDYASRSHNKSQDEIGTLARNFNRMADQLVDQIEEKALEAKQKEDFTAAFAHELKTPLTSIIGYADMLNSVSLTEAERREAYFYIYSQGKRLESLSHKLLELVSMDKTPLKMRMVSTKSLEENIRSTMRPIWKQRNIRGRVNLDKGSIWGDEELLLSLFYNLLDNAVKAMDKEGERFILIKGTALDEGYEVKVIDNGRGIPREEIGRITEAFYMVDKSRSRKEGGAGIGMALCSRIVLLHGARLSVESNLGEGTVIRVYFPASPARGGGHEEKGKEGQGDEKEQ